MVLVEESASFYGGSNQVKERTSQRKKEMIIWQPAMTQSKNDCYEHMVEGRLVYIRPLVLYRFSGTNRDARWDKAKLGIDE